MAKGGSRPGSGRKKGVPGKKTLAVRERIIALGGDPILYLVKTMNNDISCATCRGVGKTKFQPGGSSTRFEGVRTCQSCWGSKLEKISPAESLKAAMDLMGYMEAKRKAVDAAGDSADVVHHDHVIRLVE